MGTRKLGNSRTKLTLKLGNIPLELKLSRVGMEETSGLSQFSPAGNPIRYKKVDEVTGAEVPNDQILKGKKVGNDVVTFSEDELDAAYCSRQAEVGKVRVEDIADIQDTTIKSVYMASPQNMTFWGMIGGRLAECKKQLHFVYVEGKQERDAVLQIKGGVPLLYVMFFPSEVAEMAPFVAVCPAELNEGVDALFTGLSATKLPELEQTRNVVIDQLVEAKLMGKPIPTKPPVEAKVQKGKTAKELLAESLAIVNAKV